MMLPEIWVNRDKVSFILTSRLKKRAYSRNIQASTKMSPTKLMTKKMVKPKTNIMNFWRKNAANLTKSSCNISPERSMIFIA